MRILSVCFPLNPWSPTEAATHQNSLNLRRDFLKAHQTRGVNSASVLICIDQVMQVQGLKRNVLNPQKDDEVFGRTSNISGRLRSSCANSTNPQEGTGHRLTERARPEVARSNFLPTILDKHLPTWSRACKHSTTGFVWEQCFKQNWCLIILSSCVFH